MAAVTPVRILVPVHPFIFILPRTKQKLSAWKYFEGITKNFQKHLQEISFYLAFSKEIIALTLKSWVHKLK